MVEKVIDETIDYKTTVRIHDNLVSFIDFNPKGIAEAKFSMSFNAFELAVKAWDEFKR